MLGLDYFSVYRLVQRGKLKACRALRGKLAIRSLPLPPLKTIVLLSLTPPDSGTAVKLTAMVISSAATGQITFYDGPSVLGVVTLSGGSAVFTTQWQNGGTRLLRAHYSGDSNYAVGDSVIVAQRINPPTATSFTTAAASASGTPGPYLISTIAGTPFPSTPIPGTSAVLRAPAGMAVDTAGNVYFSDQFMNMVFRVDVSGNMTRVAGNGAAAYTADLPNGPAISVPLSPSALATDSSGNLYIADDRDVRRVSPGGAITTVAGMGQCGGFTGDAAPGTAVGICGAAGLAVDAAGNLYISDSGWHVVRKLGLNGTITIVAGNGTAGYGGDGGPATAAQLSEPLGLALDSSGGLLIADSNNNVIRRVSPDGQITTVAGNGDTSYIGDDIPATQAGLYYPQSVAADGSGDFYIVDTYHGRVRKVSGGIITTAAAGGLVYPSGGSYAILTLYQPAGVITDSSGDLFITDSQYGRVWKMSAGTFSTVAGGASGDSATAAFGMFSQPGPITKDQAGNAYVADSLGTRVRMISASGAISTVAGTGSSGYSGDGGPATTAQLASVTGLAVDSSGALYMADLENYRVRRVYQGVITTVAGDGSAGYSGDGVQASGTGICPFSVAVDAQDNLYIADAENNRVRRVTPGGMISTVAGNGTPGYSGDKGPATSAQVLAPQWVGFDGQGNLYIADSSFHVRMVNAQGIITTIAGNGVSASTGDGGPATLASMNVSSAAVDSAGNFYFVEGSNGTIRVVNTNGIVSTIAGNTTFPYIGPDTGPAIGPLIAADGLYADPSGVVYLTDGEDDTIRLMTLEGGRPVLTVSSTHNGTFALGSSGQYTLTVSNLPLAASTNGTIVTVTEVPPNGMSISSMSGGNWNCAGNTCRRNDSLGAGQSYSTIDVVVDIAADAPLQLTNQVTVGGGGAATTAHRTSPSSPRLPPRSRRTRPGSNSASTTSLCKLPRKP